MLFRNLLLILLNFPKISQVEDSDFNSYSTHGLYTISLYSYPQKYLSHPCTTILSTEFVSDIRHCSLSTVLRVLVLVYFKWIWASV